MKFKKLFHTLTKIILVAAGIPEFAFAQPQEETENPWLDECLNSQLRACNNYISKEILCCLESGGTPEENCGTILEPEACELQQLGPFFCSHNEDNELEFPNISCSNPTNEKAWSQCIQKLPKVGRCLPDPIFDENYIEIVSY